MLVLSSLTLKIHKLCKCLLAEERERQKKERELQYENRRLREALSSAQRATSSSSSSSSSSFNRPDSVASSSVSNYNRIQSSSSGSSAATTTSSLRASATNDAPLCCVCLDHAPEIAFHPCGHVKVCRICAVGMTECPFCRKHIASQMRVYI